MAVVVSVAAALCLAAPASGADELPPGAEVMDNNVKSTGGKQAWSRIKNRVTKGSLASGPMTAEFTQYEADSNQSRMRMKLGDMGTIEEGVTGDVAWSLNPMMGGGQIKDGALRQLALREAFFHKEVQWRNVYKDVQCTEIADFQGEPCYKVILTPKEGDNMTAYFEKDTGLQRGFEMTVESMMGQMPVTVVLNDYKEVSGVLYPHTIKQLAGGQEMTLTFESIEHNVDLPKDCFDLPEEVAALVKAQKEPEGK